MIKFIDDGNILHYTLNKGRQMPLKVGDLIEKTS